ncbi:MAG: FtsX-like permease family protein, partial [Acidobacteriales bacterium]|nr:FtsX-like permease family protein [Terriglobales bacterium]
SANDVLQELRGKDTAIVSEPFANKHHVSAGQTITVPIGEHQVPLRIVDIYYDYSSEKGIIIVDRSTMLKYLPDTAASNLAVYVKPHADIEAVRAEIMRAAAGSDVLIFSNRDIRREAIRIFDQTFSITYALEVIAIFVAVVGVAGALVSIVIDRKREFGILRFLGASKTQVRSLILIEAGMLGLLSNAVGLVLGIALSLVLVFVINKQSFGWTIQFHWPVGILVSALSVVYLATVLAGIYPARIARKLEPIEVVHDE